MKNKDKVEQAEKVLKTLCPYPTHPVTLEEYESLKWCIEIAKRLVIRKARSEEYYQQAISCDQRG